jgi:hypothetical protein
MFGGWGTPDLLGSHRGMVAALIPGGPFVECPIGGASVGPLAVRRSDAVRFFEVVSSLIRHEAPPFVPRVFGGTRCGRVAPVLVVFRSPASQWRQRLMASVPAMPPGRLELLAVGVHHLLRDVPGDVVVVIQRRGE